MTAGSLTFQRRRFATPPTEPWAPPSYGAEGGTGAPNVRLPAVTGIATPRGAKSASFAPQWQLEGVPRGK